MRVKTSKSERNERLYGMENSENVKKRSKSAQNVLKTAIDGQKGSETVENGKQLIFKGFRSF